MEEPTTTDNTHSSPQIIQNNGRFHGSGGEFFGIWIVNLLLTILTLGIYSAWATVRTRKYFYRNTELAGSRFDFHGKPIPILIGRIIGISLFGLYSFSSYINEFFSIAVFMFVVIAFPWLFAQSWGFRLRNTSWRGIHFDFRGQVGEIYRRLGIYILIITVSQGLGLYFSLRPDSEYIFLFIFGSLIISLIVYPCIYAKIMDIAINKAYIGHSQCHLIDLQPEWIRLFFKVFFLYITLVIIIVIGVFGILSSAASVFENLQENFITIVFMYLLLVMAYVVPVSFWQVGKLNLIFDNTTINGAPSNAKLKVSEYIKLMLTNTLLTTLTCGLAYPWAAVRIARYQIQHIGFYGDADNFSGTKLKDKNALGQEVTSAFDMEIGL